MQQKDCGKEKAIKEKGSGKGGKGGKGGGGGGGRALGGHLRLKNRQGRRQSSVHWLERQLNDPYVRQARLAGYRARAAYKLLELDARYHMLRGARRVVDLGTAPGSWAQVVLAECPGASVAGIDLLEMEPLAGLHFLQGDFLDEDMEARLMEVLSGPADLVLSDMAANTVGHQQTDYLRTMALVEAAAFFADRVLAPGGNFVAKVLGGGADAVLVQHLKRQFRAVHHAKPPASRKESSETYVVALGFRGTPA